MLQRSEYAVDVPNAPMRTMSFYSRLSQTQRQALEREHEAAYQGLGRPVRASMAAILVTARNQKYTAN